MDRSTMGVLTLMVSLQIDQVANVVLGLMTRDAWQIVPNARIQVAFAFADDVQLRLETATTRRSASVDGEEAVFAGVAFIQLVTVA